MFCVSGTREAIKGVLLHMIALLSDAAVQFVHLLFLYR